MPPHDHTISEHVGEKLHYTRDYDTHAVVGRYIGVGIEVAVCDLSDRHHDLIAVVEETRVSDGRMRRREHRNGLSSGALLERAIRKCCA